MAIRAWLDRRGKSKRKPYVLRWREDILTPDGSIRRVMRQESCRTSGRVTAKAMLRAKTPELNTARPLPAPANRATIDDLILHNAEWMRNRLRVAGTIYCSTLALKHLGGIPGKGKPVHLAAIGPEEIERFVGGRGKTVKPKSVNRELSDLRAAFNRGVKAGIVEKNPFAGVEMLPLDKKAIKPLSTEEEQQLRQACARDLQLDAYVRLGLDTGCRAGEISHLQ